MASTSETGHGKNMDHASKRILVLKDMGGVYQPSNPLIKLDVLQARVLEAENAHKAILELAGPYKTAITNRKVAYKQMGTWSTRIKSTAKSSGISLEMMNTVDGLVKKINGQRIGDKPEAKEGEKGPNANSVSQMSFVSRMDNFKALAKQLEAIPEYAPNEAENKVETMLAYVNELAALNKIAFPLEENYGKAIGRRNELFYTENTGIVDLLETAKAYVFGLGEKGKPAYKSLMKLPLKKY